jgi:hypothetical protein
MPLRIAAICTETIHAQMTTFFLLRLAFNHAVTGNAPGCTQRLGEANARNRAQNKRSTSSKQKGRDVNTGNLFLLLMALN